MHGEGNRYTFFAGLAASVFLCATLVLLAAAGSTEEISPVTARPLDVYVPNTEDLAPDEMRVIACGTGMPTTRMSQAAAFFLVELGNGDKFIFDLGNAAAERLSALQIPYDYLGKVVGSPDGSDEEVET